VNEYNPKSSLSYVSRQKECENSQTTKMSRQVINTAPELMLMTAVMIASVNAQSLQDHYPAARAALANIRSDYVPTYNNPAKAYFLARIPELSVASYQEALRRDPSNLIARRGLTFLTQAGGARQFL
jgi:hypothetical protein